MTSTSGCKLKRAQKTLTIHQKLEIHYAIPQKSYTVLWYRQINDKQPQEARAWTWSVQVEDDGNGSRTVSKVMKLGWDEKIGSGTFLWFQQK